MNKIKESFDYLPVAVCFFDANGVVRLINHRMLAIAGLLQKDGVQTLAEMEAALKAPPVGICCADQQLRIYRFPGGKALRFAQKQIATKAGIQYTQVTATDVTELMLRQCELNEENAKLAEANERLRKIFEQMPEIIREEETLAMKQRVHDDIGHSILAARRALRRQSRLEEIKESAVLFERAIEVLYRSNQLKVTDDSLENVICRAIEMGVRVLPRGKAPETPKNLALTALAINECAANCSRHAGGTELYVRFQRIRGRDVLVLSNNGAPPKKEIREGGGLSTLRRRVEEAGGTMEIQSIPCFKLFFTLPEEEVREHESNDC